jgi:hypothetical protein
MTKNEHLSDLYERAMLYMEQVLASLAKKVPPPKMEPITNGHVFRFAEKTLQQAIVQKLARIISANRASEVLLNAGFLHELGALHRQIDEACEDVLFLALGSREDTLPERHRKFLDAFYGEEIVGGKPTGKPDARKGEVPRQKIRAYIAENSGKGINQNAMIEVGKTLHKAYSGYVHGGSPTIMEMYGGNPARFHVRGMGGTSTQNSFRSSMFNYYFRAFMAFYMSLVAFGLTPDEGLKQLFGEFDKAAGS